MLFHCDPTPFCCSSWEAAKGILAQMEDGSAVRFEWVHCALDGTPLYVDVQAMVRGRGRVKFSSFRVVVNSLK